MSQLELPQISIATETSTPPIQRWGDLLGLIASVGCAIHCAATPILIALLPSWGFSWLADEAFHQWMFAACFLIAVMAFVPGIRRHGRWMPLGIGCLGLALIGVAAFYPNVPCCHGCGEHGDPVVLFDGSWLAMGWSGWWNKLAPWITPLGGAFLVTAHLYNHRFGCHCHQCHGHSHD
jgi:hypothetical protein